MSARLVALSGALIAAGMSLAPTAQADPTDDALAKLRAQAESQLVAAGVPGNADQHKLARMTLCNYLNGEIPVYQAAIAIPTNLGSLDHPATLSTAHLAALGAALQLPEITLADRHVVLCYFEHPERVAQKMAELEACPNPTALYAKDRC